MPYMIFLSFRLILMIYFPIVQAQIRAENARLPGIMHHPAWLCHAEKCMLFAFLWYEALDFLRQRSSDALENLFIRFTLLPVIDHPVALRPLRMSGRRIALPCSILFLLDSHQLPPLRIRQPILYRPPKLVERIYAAAGNLHLTIHLHYHIYNGRISRTRFQHFTIRVRRDIDHQCRRRLLRVRSFTTGCIRDVLSSVFLNFYNRKLLI